MRGASHSWLEQQNAVRQEYETAVASKDHEKATAIKTANPDIDFTTKETEA